MHKANDSQLQAELSEMNYKNHQLEMKCEQLQQRALFSEEELAKRGKEQEPIVEDNDPIVQEMVVEDDEVSQDDGLPAVMEVDFLDEIKTEIDLRVEPDLWAIIRRQAQTIDVN